MRSPQLQRGIPQTGESPSSVSQELPAIRSTGFHLYARSLSAAEGYAHIIDMGHPVEIANMVIRPGDLIHGDIHGIVHIPTEIAAQLPETAGRILGIKREAAALCSSQEFSLERLMALLKDLE